MLKDPLTLLGILDRLANLLRADLRRIGGAASLQAVHLQALIYLAQANRFSNTPQALAEYLGLTKGTVSQSLLLLDRRGLIERYEDEVDRRVVRLRLSDSGSELLQASGLHELWRSATRDVSAGRIRTVVSTLRETLFLVQAEAGGSNFGTCETCVHWERRSARIYHCGWYGERLGLPESRLLCRAHAPRPALLPRER
jgi:DNA-binding MarR family transcriptional regulator